jgi:hypothetical protein
MVARLSTESCRQAAHRGPAIVEHASVDDDPVHVHALAESARLLTAKPRAGDQRRDRRGRYRRIRLPRQ